MFSLQVSAWLPASCVGVPKSRSGGSDAQKVHPAETGKGSNRRDGESGDVTDAPAGARKRNQEVENYFRRPG